MFIWGTGTQEAPKFALFLILRAYLKANQRLTKPGAAERAKDGEKKEVVLRLAPWPRHMTAVMYTLATQ